MKTFLLPALISMFVLNGWNVLQHSADAQPKPTQTSVLWSDIGNKVQIIGRLGKPMNTMMSLRGEWRKPEVEPAKPGNDGPDFSISHVDGTALNSPVRFLKHTVTISPGRGQDVQWKPVAGDIWECRACEVGSFPNAASKHWEDFYGAPVSPIGYEGEFAPELLIAQRTVRKTPVIRK